MQSGMPLCGVLVGWLINGSRSRLCENTAAVQFQGHRAPPAMLMVDPGLISRSFLYVRACQSSFIQPRSKAVVSKSTSCETNALHNVPVLQMLTAKSYRS